MRAKIPLIIGVVTMSLSTLIYELDFLWLFLDLLGMFVAYTGLRKGEEGCKAGLILCALAGLFSFSMICIVYFASR